MDKMESHKYQISLRPGRDGGSITQWVAELDGRDVTALFFAAMDAAQVAEQTGGPSLHISMIN